MSSTRRMPRGKVATQQKHPKRVQLSAVSKEVKADAVPVQSIGPSNGLMRLQRMIRELPKHRLGQLEELSRSVNIRLGKLIELTKKIEPTRHDQRATLCLLYEILSVVVDQFELAADGFVHLRQLGKANSLPQVRSVRQKYRQAFDKRRSNGNGAIDVTATLQLIGSLSRNSL